IYIDNPAAANRAINLPEFVNIAPNGLQNIDVPASEFYRVVDLALDEQKKGDNAAALAQWKKALEMEPDDARANNGMGIALSVAGNSAEAIDYFRKATQLNGDFFEAFYNLGLELVKKNRVNQAIDAWLNTVRIRPQFAGGHENLGYAFYLQGDFKAAISHLRSALAVEPDRVSVLNLAASLLATCPDSSIRNSSEAMALAERANRLTDGKDPSILDTLSAAYAEAGRFPQAIETEQQAMNLATQQRKSALAETLKIHLGKYRSNMPLREPPDPVSF
ncbi:MAG: tetratricopeptide repeat protein, partial [Candidatus Sulfotelmatobacter sp.]